MPQKNQVLKIGIDARFFGPKQKGLGRYVQKLVEGLEQTDRQNKYVIFLRKDNWRDFQCSNPNFKKVLADFRWYSLEEQIWMPFKIWQQKIDLMHFPHFNIPILYFSPFIVTIHDLILKKFPTQRATTLSSFRYWLKNLGYKVIIFLAIKRAKKVIAVSEYTKKDIIKHFKIKKDKIQVIYEGGPKNTKQQSLPLLQNQEPIKDLQLNKPYVLYVGNAYPHKNLERLIWSFVKLTTNNQKKNKYKNLKLVLVGELDYFYRRLKNIVHFSMPDIRRRIIFAGFVSDQALDLLYSHANLYVFPSMCEGFGLPPLEAMTYGCPVLSSRATCLPEILGSAALYFNPTDIDEITVKIKKLLDSANLRKKMISRGYQRIKVYSWSKMAKETSSVYKIVID